MSGRLTLAAPRALAALFSAGLIGVALAGCSPDQEPTDVPGTTPSVVTDQPLPPGAEDDVDGEPNGQIAVAEIKDTSGKVVGKATISAATESEKPVTISVQVNAGDLPAGFHGMHIHENGSCDAARADRRHSPPRAVTCRSTATRAIPRAVISSPSTSSRITPAVPSPRPTR